MIVYWIVGSTFLIAGLLFAAPMYIKFLKCKGRTTGKIVRASASHGANENSVRACYEYYVDGKRYVKSTGNTSFGIFITGRECNVRYDIKKPECSYIMRVGQIIDCMIASAFVLAGMGVFLIGLYEVFF